MSKQIIFIAVLTVAAAAFIYTSLRLLAFFRITKNKFKIDRIPERIWLTLLVAFGQTKIMRRPVIGLMHALVWWGFLVISIGTAEMAIDGIINTERILGKYLGVFYDLITASGDIFSAIIIIACVAFILRRVVIRVKRFSGIEMTKGSRLDALIALSLILLLMVSLTAMNMGYLLANFEERYGSYPVSNALLPLIAGQSEGWIHTFFESAWWTHITLVFLFLNILPYSKHFHVIMSVPNVFLSTLKPMTKIDNMESITREVRLMLNPEPPATAISADTPPERFGIRDVQDVSWKNYVDALTCTECGRCTSVCPANITGKLLSPRKLFIDLRKRMNDKGPALVKDDKHDDGKSLVGNYITQEELWACTTCNACVQECPVNIDHVSFIIDMRRSLVMEQSSAPAALIQMFNNIENNGSPWQFSPADRMKWAENLFRRHNE